MNIYLVNILVIAAIIILSYLIGSIPTGVVIGRAFFHKDPRDYFSKNSGGTNVGRVFGPKIGVLCIILDIIKTVSPIYITWAVLTFTGLREYSVWGSYDARPLLYWGAGLIATVGHCWPIYLKFKGGKATASYMGINVTTSWLQFLVLGATFLIVLLPRKIVSKAAITSALFGAVFGWVFALVLFLTKWNPEFFFWTFGLTPGLALGWEFALTNSIEAAILILRHKENIKRLKAGTESSHPWKVNS